jgi:UDP-N-acetylmuramate dehydrogenase
MSFPDIVPGLKSKMPALRGRLLANQSLAELTWFRVGGPAQVLFMPDDADDLGYLLANLPAEIPVTVIGLGSNLIVRDGGVPGVAVRLGRGFGDIVIEGVDVPAPRCPTSRSHARRRRPALPGCRSCAASPAASAARCA